MSAKREEGRAEEKGIFNRSMYTPCHSYVCFVSQFEVSPQGIVLCALLSAVFRNNGVANLIENWCSLQFVW